MSAPSCNWLLPLSLFLMVLCPAGGARADGKFFRRLEVADEPGIQAQRAVIAFRNGHETLIVQSDVQGEGTSFGWVLPLPAEPTAIEPCAVHTLISLSNVVRPRVSDLPQDLVILIMFVPLITIAACLDVLRYRGQPKVLFSPWRITVYVASLFILISILLPSLSAPRGLSGEVEILQTGKAGVYDVAIIKGKTGSAVAEWLKSNGFAWSSSADPVMQGYVAAGWCFLVAKVAPDAAGTMSHHPLKVTFPTDEAVYPLRLTGVDAEPIQLDLYVIGERRALAKGMRTWLCDTFSLKTDHHSLWSYVNISPAVFVGSKTRSLVGIPAVSAIMWPGCVLTRLHGRLDRDDMKSDLTLNWVEPRPVRATLYPRTGAMALSGCVSAIAFALAFAWSTRTAAKRGWRIGAMVRNRLLPTIVVALVAGAVAYSMLEVVPVKSKGREEIRSLLAPLWAHHSVLQQLEREPPALPFPEAYQMQLSDHLDPEAKREDFEALALPGDFRIEPAEDGWRLTILDSYFVPVSIPVNPNGSPCSVGD